MPNIRHRPPIRWQPQTPVKISKLALDKGLVWLSLGNGLFWTKARGWSSAVSRNGAPKQQSGIHGTAYGFSSAGSGSGEYVTTPDLPSTTGFRSIYALYNSATTGGGALGRVFQQGTAGVAGEALFHSGGYEMTYIRTYNTGTAGQWGFAGTAPLGSWVGTGLSHDQTATGTTPVFYKNGVVAATTVLGASSGTYDVINAPVYEGGRPSGSRDFDGMVGVIAIFEHPTTPLSAADHALIHNNPNTFLFENKETNLYWQTNTGTTINTIVGNITAAGVTAVVTNTSGTTINTTVGNATASGVTAIISRGQTILTTVGNITAAGTTASINTAPAGFVTDVWINNTGTAWTPGTGIHFTWFPSGRIGAFTSPVQGTGILDSQSRFTLTSGAAGGSGGGVLIGGVRQTSAADDYIYYEAGTVP